VFPKFGYFSRETLISLRRNLLMTLAGILTVTVSLFLFGGILLLSKLVDHGTQRWKHGVGEIVFMRVDATQNQIDAVQEKLKNDSDVKRYRFVTKDDAYKDAKGLFKNEPDLISSITADDLPTSFKVTPRKAEVTETVAKRFRPLAGVDEVQSAAETTKSLLSFTNYVRWLFFGLSAVLLASSLFLIVNTIRLATFARRREIEVMKLVGASNSFVRIPFMLEGLVQGAVGAGLAFGGIFLLGVLLQHLLAHPSQFTRGYYVTTPDALSIGFRVLVLGALIGLTGSLVGLRRFLRV
jgi:cell division transport system permease protein